MNMRSLKKLRSRSGETIAETLVGVLIAALALTMLAGAISASLNVITTSETKMNEYYGKNEDLAAPAKEGMTVTLEDDSGEINLLPKTGSESGIGVKYSTNDTFTTIPVAAYSL